MLLYQPVHHLIYDFHDAGQTDMTFTDLDEAFDAADAHNRENNLQAGDSGYARVHTEYQRDDISGHQYWWTVDLTDEGDLHVTDEPPRSPYESIRRGYHPARLADDDGPTFKPWFGNAAGTVVYKWEVGVVAKTRTAAYKSARHALGAHQATMKATAAAAEYPTAAAAAPDETTEADRIRDGHDFPRTPRGYPYEGPQNVPGASNAVLPAVDGRTLAHHLDEDMTALEGRVDLMERQFAGLVAKFGLVKVNDNPIIYRRLGPAGFHDITPVVKELAHDLVGLIDYARTTGDETGVEAFTAAFVGDPRIHPTAIPALTSAVGAVVPILITAMASREDRGVDDGDRDE